MPVLINSDLFATIGLARSRAWRVQAHAAGNHFFHDFIGAAVNALHARIGVGAGGHNFTVA